VKNQRGEGVIIALLANKVDLEERDITEIEGRELAERNGINFKEVSAKTGANIQEFFKEIAAQLPDVNEPTNRQKMGESSVMNVTKTEPLKPPSSQNIVLTNPKESSARA
jgi:Fe2+ transport system protein B